MDFLTTVTANPLFAILGAVVGLLLAGQMIRWVQKTSEADDEPTN